MKAGGVKVID